MSENARKRTGCPGGEYRHIAGHRILAHTDFQGYHESVVGHGKAYDSDALKETTGCHGKDNRILCLNNEVQAKNCNWNRQKDGVRKNFTGFDACFTC